MPETGGPTGEEAPQQRAREPGRPRVVALFGPTGVGKTEVAVEIAALLRARGEDPVAVSADALQVYEGLGTVTGAPSPAELAGLEHRLLGFVPVDRSFSVGEFMPLAHHEVDRALAAGRRPIVVGGTGLYLRAAIAELDLRPPPRPGVRERLEESSRDRGVEALHSDLRRLAPAAADRIDRGDRSRVIRALELLGMDEDPGAWETERSQLWTEATRHPTLLVGLVLERSELYGRIDARVDAMLAAGAREEVRRADAAGASATARKALGFEELLRGDVEGMKRRTRNYARRQLTWMRKLPATATVDTTGRRPAEVAAEALRLVDGEARSTPAPPRRAGAQPSG